GISDDAIMLNGGQPAADAVAAWRKLGVDTVRIQVGWSRTVPNPASRQMPADFNPNDPNDPQYQWGRIDDAVKRLVRAQIKPILMLDGPPPLWASSKPLANNPRYKPIAWQFGAFASAVAQRYAEDVDTYILWNEPNLPLWIQPQAGCRGKKCIPVSPDIYRFMVRSAYPAIHAADGSATVLIGTLAPAGGNLTSRNANMRPLQFMRALGCLGTRLQRITDGACKTFQPAMADGFAYHPHSTKRAPDEPYDNPDDADLASLRAVERLLDRLQATGRLQTPTPQPLGIWLDEYAYQTNPPDKQRGIPQGRQDRYLQQAGYLAWRDPRVQLLSQYLWNDEPAGGGRSYTGWQSGLNDASGKPKLALAHFDDPIWIDFPLNLIWGQVRKGDAHSVELQVRPAGTTSAWTPLTSVTTADDGTWSVQTPLSPYASYRAVSDDGNVTATLVAAPPSASTSSSPTIDEGAALLERRDVGTTPGAPVPPNYTGMSIEYRSVPDYIGQGGKVNTIFAELMRTLARAGNGAPTLRFGGDSSDATWWNPTGQPRPPGIVTDITPAWVNHLSAWELAVKTPLVLGLNLGLNDPANAAQYAHAAATTVPAGSVTTFELGNEPDLYTQPRRYKVGNVPVVRSQKRQAPYEYEQLRSELDSYVNPIAAAAPGIALSAPAFASPSWDDDQTDLLNRYGYAVPVYSAHAYPLPTCEPSARRPVRSSYANTLLAGRTYTPIVQRMTQLVNVATANGAAVRVSELNSAICGGLLGVSNTFASTLWGTDLLFGLAEAGVRNVDFHSWTGSRYSAVDFTHGNGNTNGHVRPLFYAMLLFNRAAPRGSRLLPVGPNAPTAAVKTWATVDAKGVRRIVVINKDPGNARSLLLKAPLAQPKATVERLLAPSLHSTHYVTLGGQGYGDITKDGRLRGKKKLEPLKAQFNGFKLRMPPGSAALVTVKPAPARRAAPPARRR
ncbi:MAG: glycosyl hydrolase family 79 C-terminal domain-containing protein, partial [Solirubrobacteraceae bacterium]